MQLISYDPFVLLFENRRNNLGISEIERSSVQLIASCERAFRRHVVFLLVLKMVLVKVTFPAFQLLH